MKDKPLDELVTLIRVLREDSQLRRQFQKMGKLPENLRISLIGQIEAGMRAEGEDDNARAGVAALQNPEICRAVRKTLAALLVESHRKKASRRLLKIIQKSTRGSVP